MKILGIQLQVELDCDETNEYLIETNKYYEQINKVLVRTKRHPLGKILIDADDKTAIDNVKSFCASSEEATKTYKVKEEN